MTRTARYYAETNTFRELPGMEKPENPAEILGKGADIYFFHASQRLREYNDHVASLREIPCHESCRSVFKDQGVYEEGKDYKLYQYEDRLTLAYPIEKDSEDEDKLWYQVKDLTLSAMDKNLSPEEWVGLMKGLYHITPR